MPYFPQPDRFSVIPRSVSDEGSPLMEEGIALLQLLQKLIFCCSGGDKAEILRSLRTTKIRSVGKGCPLPIMSPRADFARGLCLLGSNEFTFSHL